MDIQALLQHLGITPNYRGFHFLLSARQILHNNPNALLLVTKHLYPYIAMIHNTSWSAVERSLRTAVQLAWAHNPALLQQMAGFPLTHKPTVSQFLSILIHYSPN